MKNIDNYQGPLRFCKNCNQDVPLCLFKKRKNGGKLVYRTYCDYCELKAHRIRQQTKLAESFTSGNKNIDVCPLCKSFFSIYASGISKGVKRSTCRPCSQKLKLRDSTMFNEARDLLLKYAANQPDAQWFFSKYMFPEDY